MILRLRHDKILAARILGFDRAVASTLNQSLSGERTVPAARRMVENGNYGTVEIKLSNMVDKGFGTSDAMAVIVL